MFGACKLEYSSPVASYANLDVVISGWVGSGVVVGSDVGAGVAARAFSIIEEATKVKLITSTMRIMPLFNSTLCVVKFLSHLPLRL